MGSNPVRVTNKLDIRNLRFGIEFFVYMRVFGDSNGPDIWIFSNLKTYIILFYVWHCVL